MNFSRKFTARMYAKANIKLKMPDLLGNPNEKTRKGKGIKIEEMAVQYISR